jgi:hypothetical protein
MSHDEKTCVNCGEDRSGEASVCEECLGDGRVRVDGPGRGVIPCPKCRPSDDPPVVQINVPAVAPLLRGDHVHQCPECYEKVPCAEVCSLEYGLFAEGETPCGSYAVCDGCEAKKRSETAIPGHGTIELPYTPTTDTEITCLVCSATPCAFEIRTRTGGTTGYVGLCAACRSSFVMREQCRPTATADTDYDGSTPIDLAGMTDRFLREEHPNAGTFRTELIDLLATVEAMAMIRDRVQGRERATDRHPVTGEPYEAIMRTIGAEKQRLREKNHELHTRAQRVEAALHDMLRLITEMEADDDFGITEERRLRIGKARASLSSSPDPEKK